MNPSEPERPSVTRLTIHISKSQERTYFTVPFSVPPAVAQLDVTYSYEGHIRGEAGDLHPVSTIDLGLADEKGHFLGWSGSSRSHIRVGEADSTAGYLCGPVRPGQWSILVGAYHVPQDGVDVAYTITFSYHKTLLLFGDLHVHSTASDGRYSRYELAVRARKEGLDFIAFSDHNNFSENFHQPYVEGITVIPAVEWTHYNGHVNLYGVPDPFENSFLANTPEEKRSLLSRARARGAVISVNHPDCPICPYRWDDQDYDLMEIWNGPMTRRNEKALQRWTRELSRRPLPAVAGSDFHKDLSPVRLGHPVTGVFAQSRTPEGILKAIRHGHCFVTFGVRGPQLWLKAGQTFMGGSCSQKEVLLCGRRFSGESVSVVSSDGETLLFPGVSGCFAVPFPVRDQTFLYLKAFRTIAGRKLVRAVSNPVYFTKEPSYEQC